MIQLNAQRLHHLIVYASMLEASLSTRRMQRGANVRVIINGALDGAGHFIEDYDDQIRLLKGLGLDECAVALERVKRCENGFRADGVDEDQILRFEDLLKDFRGRLFDALKRPCFLVLMGYEKEFYTPSSPLFGEAVFKRFPNANSDVSEAGKCLALGQGTAAVFHLMRVMEIGLKSLAADLGIPYAPSWESYIKQLSTLLDGKNWNNLSEPQKAKRPMYTNLLGDFTSIKMAWRNPTMHVKGNYSVSEAHTIFNTVKQFMDHLAKQLSQIDDPEAS